MSLNIQELEKANTHIIVEIIEYIPKSVVIKTIIKKNTGNISYVLFDSGEALSEKISPFDTFIQTIDGVAAISIDGAVRKPNVGEPIIIPTNTQYY